MVYTVLVRSGYGTGLSKEVTGGKHENPAYLGRVLRIYRKGLKLDHCNSINVPLLLHL